MALLNPSVQKQVRTALAAMTRPIRVAMFTQGDGGALECEMCADTRHLVEELAGLSDKVTLEVHDFVAEAALAERYGVDKIPALVLLGDGPEPRDHGIRFYGIPSGYEFGTLLQDFVAVSKGTADLSAGTVRDLQKLTKPVHMQVFVTPT